MTKAVRDSNPALRFGASFAELADKLYMSPAHCLLYVARRVADGRQARARNRWVGGRFYNWLTGSETEYVVLSGAVLGNSLKWLDQVVPDGLPRGVDLKLPFEIAEALDTELRAKAKAEGMTV